MPHFFFRRKAATIQQQQAHFLRFARITIYRGFDRWQIKGAGSLRHRPGRATKRKANGRL
jgi:hypothetical protein